MSIIDYQSEELKKNIVLKEVNTRKYKDVNIYFSFLADLNRKEKAIMSLLKELIGLTSVKYPTKKEMIREKCLLYGASIDANVTSFAYKSCLCVHYNFVDPKYLEDITWSDYLGFIKDTLFSPILSEENIRENSKILSDVIRRSMDKPSVYSKIRVNQILAEEEKRFSLMDGDLSKELSEITLEEVDNTFTKILNESKVEIVAIGDLDEKFIIELKKLPLEERENSFKDYDEAKLSDRNLIIENKNVPQSALMVVYKLNVHDVFVGKNYYALLLGNALLGLLPCSLLFSEIREKQSLCYTVSSADNKKDGMITISTLISGKNIKKVEKEIDKQMKILEKGSYSDETFIMSKRLFIDSLTQNMDDADGIYNYLHSRGFYSNESFDEMCRGIESITREDLSDLFKGFRHVLTYGLKGDEEKVQ